jgi:hypothetical protein
MSQDVIRPNTGDEPSRALHSQSFGSMLNVNRARGREITMDQRVDHHLTHRAGGIVGERQLDPACQIERPGFDPSLD